jgi:hypothetical protein
MLHKGQSHIGYDSLGRSETIGGGGHGRRLIYGQHLMLISNNG